MNLQATSTLHEYVVFECLDEIAAYIRNILPTERKIDALSLENN